jgi:hypothetical protein
LQITRAARGKAKWLGAKYPDRQGGRSPSLANLDPAQKSLLCGHSVESIKSGEQQELIKKIKRLPPASVAEVEDFVDSLARREGILDRRRLHQSLADYAIQHAGTNADLDPDLEAATADHLLHQASQR